MNKKEIAAKLEELDREYDALGVELDAVDAEMEHLCDDCEEIFDDGYDTDYCGACVHYTTWSCPYDPYEEDCCPKFLECEEIREKILTRMWAVDEEYGDLNELKEAAE